jgi:hypothetical protein
MVPVSWNGKVQGAFAWHVSDESLKARINLYRDPSQNTTVAKKRALLAGHRPDPTFIKSTAGTSLDFLPTDVDIIEFEKAQASTSKVVDLDQANLLSPTAKLKQFRNDVTPYSLGVLTDVRRGGLKQDLSSIFEMSTAAATIALPTEFTNKKLYQSTHGITGVSDPNWSTLQSYYNTFRSITTPETNPTFSQKPPSAIPLPVGAAVPPVPTLFYPGPVIAKAEVLFSYVTADAHGNWIGSLAAVDPLMKYMAHLVYTPLVTLHNPYNVTLQFEKLDVTIRNVPIAFQFYVNGQPQNTRMVSLTDMFVYGTDRHEKKFVMKIANWSAPGSSSTSGPIIMKPGQTLVCGPYLNPTASVDNPKEVLFFDWQNNSTGDDSAPINAKPGFAGPCVGYMIDWLTPLHDGLVTPGQQTDRDQGVLGLRPADKIYMEYLIQQPTLGLNTSFQVTAKLTALGRQFDYGGLEFTYRNDATLKKFFNKTFRYPTTGVMTLADTQVLNSEVISKYALARTVAIFSAYGRTTSGGVYETGKRSPTEGTVNSQVNGRLAGKPFLFHNPARTVVTMDLQRVKPGGHSHELNFQQFNGRGAVDDYFALDSTNRTPYLTGNTTTMGIKSGSYLELSTGPMQTIADFRRSNALTSYFLPNFVQPVGNSQVSPIMSTTKVNQTDTALASYALLDHSVLANHALFDRFYFSTFATTGTIKPDSMFENFMDGSRPLLSQSFQPYLPADKTNKTAKAELFAAGKPTSTAYQKAAEYQLVNGAFNVNSTNVQAWKAVLAAMNKSDIVVLWAKTAGLEIIKSTGVPIMAMSMVNGGGGVLNAAKIDDAKTREWNSNRELSEPELTTLAEKIVEQVRTRGPFLSMSEFVNRQIGTDSELTRMGALEAAITQSKINDKMFNTQVPITAADIADTNLYKYNTPLAATGNPAAGAPGWISQGDLLRILEPAATVRSDTFVIRVCGEAQDAAGKVTARAFAEAVVQRIPEYIDPVNRPSLNVYTDTSAAPANKTFGRRMNVISFRWLSANEI